MRYLGILSPSCIRTHTRSSSFHCTAQAENNNQNGCDDDEDFFLSGKGKCQSEARKGETHLVENLHMRQETLHQLYMANNAGGVERREQEERTDSSKEAECPLSSFQNWLKHLCTHTHSLEKRRPPGKRRQIGFGKRVVGGKAGMRKGRQKKTGGCW